MFLWYLIFKLAAGKNLFKLIEISSDYCKRGLFLLAVISFVITWVALKGRQDYSRLNNSVFAPNQFSLNWFTTFQYIHDHAGVAYPTAQFNPWRTIIKNLVFRKSFIYFRVDRFSISPQKYRKYKIAEKTSCLKKCRNPEIICTQFAMVKIMNKHNF